MFLPEALVNLQWPLLHLQSRCIALFMGLHGDFALVQVQDPGAQEIPHTAVPSQARLEITIQVS